MSPTMPDDDQALRRKRALRTAIFVGAVAFAIYAAFILSGVLGR